jgi:60 kDa SS-A/Ro ribonucleoprotein
MSKLNPLVKIANLFVEDRLAGGSGLKAAKQDNISLLKRCVLANLLWENNAYIDGVSVTDEISRLIPLCNENEVANLAIEGRLKQKLRHTPLFILVEMFKHGKSYAKYASDAIPLVITRADMITDMVAIYWKDGKKPLPAQMKKGLSKAFNNFNEYQFAKYDRNSAIKLRDIMFLIHPRPEQGKEQLFKKIADRTLTTPDTWEVALSTGKDKGETFTRLIQENKLGGLAMLRNIRNMMDSNVDKKVIKEGLAKLKSSMLLPLDFLKAARVNEEFSRDIEDAMIGAYKNLPKLPGKTLFIVDVSGSMGSLTSGASAFSRLDQACAMAMLAINQCEDYNLVATAGKDYVGGAHEYIKYPSKGFDLANQIVKTKSNIGGGGIFTRQCLEWCKKNVGSRYDRIIIFSDSQDCDQLNRIPKPFGTYNYICDVSAHKKGINYKNVWTAEISGWSENFLTYIAASEGLENSFQE